MGILFARHAGRLRRWTITCGGQARCRRHRTVQAVETDRLHGHMSTHTHAHTHINMHTQRQTDADSQIQTPIKTLNKLGWIQN